MSVQVSPVPNLGMKSKRACIRNKQAFHYFMFRLIFGIDFLVETSLKLDFKEPFWFGYYIQRLKINKKIFFPL